MSEAKYYDSRIGVTMADKTILNYDVAVIGGGTAGVPAAIQAARAGARTLLVEKNSILGGTITAGGVNFPGLFHAWGKQVISGIGWDLVQQTVATTGGSLPDFSVPVAQHWKQQVRISRHIYAALCDEAVLAAGVTLCLHTMVASVQEDDAGWNIQLCGKEGLRTIHASVIVDCTGDANVVSLAGLPVNQPEECQPATQICNVSGYQVKELDLESINRALKAEIAAGRIHPMDISWDHSNPTVNGWLNCAGNNVSHLHCSHVRDSVGKTNMELAARSSLLRVYRFLRQQPGLGKLALPDMAMECGIRETATIVGEETITQADYCTGRVWPDSVCYAFYPVDLHKASGGGLDCRKLSEGTVPTVPLRALIPKGAKRFAVAGRCVSSDRLANSGLRVQASCMAMGQAAGGWAALCSKQADGPVNVDELKGLLRQHGAIVPG